jgi:hypothetical protein
MVYVVAVDAAFCVVPQPVIDKSTAQEDMPRRPAVSESRPRFRCHQNASGNTVRLQRIAPELPACRPWVGEVAAATPVVKTVIVELTVVLPGIIDTVEKEQVAPGGRPAVQARATGFEKAPRGVAEAAIAYCTGIPVATVCVGGEAARVKSVTMTVYGVGVGREKLFPLFETAIETVFTPIGQEMFARNPGPLPVAVPLPQLPVHCTVVRGQLFGSLPAATITAGAPEEPRKSSQNICGAVPFQKASNAANRPYRESTSPEKRQPKRSFTGSSKFCLQPR